LVVLGNMGLESVSDWVPDPGCVWLWHSSPATVEKAHQAPISAVPPSYIQARHLRGFREQMACGLDMSRLLVAALDFTGQCDIRAMTYVINSHLRRHDTYRSWFEFTDTQHIVRRTIGDPADIELIPVEHGEMTPKQWQDYILTTPSPLEWDCFRFAIIQRDDHFTLCISIDHLHFDATFIGTIFLEIRSMYDVLMDGGVPIPLQQVASYGEYCLRERAYTSALTLESPEIRKWIQFFEGNDGSLPSFPLPLGDTSLLAAGGVLSLRLMDARQTAGFEAACTDAGARFSGGVFACAALAEYELTGAQGSFDSSTHLANVPFERVLELAPWLTKPPSRGGFPMLSFLDAGVPPLSAVITSQLGRANARVFTDGKIAARVCMWVNKFHDETTMTASFPDNPIAHDSVARYLVAMKSACVRVAEGRGEMTRSRNGAQLQRQPL
jgi:hypothetical protein